MFKTSFGEKSDDNVTRGKSPVNQVPSSGKRHLMKAAALLGGMTLISRILGMIRDIVSARSFGTSWQWDGFIYAFMFPNFFRRLVGEGALSSAFIPVYNEISEREGKNQAFRFANITLTLLACGLLGFVLVVEGLLALLLKFAVFPETVMLTLSLLRILFPYLWFISLFALGMGVLNSHRHFFAPSLGPILLNGIWIASILWIIPMAGSFQEDQLHWLAWALLFSGFLHLVFELPPLYRIGYRPSWIWEVAYPGLQKVWKLLLPVVMSFAIVQINIMVDMTLGIMIGAGANSSLWYGTRLMQFPLGVFAIAMGTALLPMMSKQITGNQREEAKKTLSFALRTVFFIIIPAGLGLIVLRSGIIQLLFERGEFDALSTLRTSRVLLGYAIGLFAYAGLKIVTTGYYAAQDSKTPMKIGVVALILNIVLNLILMHPFKEAGLALATALAAIVQLGLLVYFYPKKVGDFPFKDVVNSFFRISFASIAMAIVCFFGWQFLKNAFAGTELTSQLIQILGSIGIALVAYLGFCFVFQVREVKEAFKRLIAKKA